MERFDNKMLLHPEENTGMELGDCQDLKDAHPVGCHQRLCCSPARLAGQGMPVWQRYLCGSR